MTEINVKIFTNTKTNELEGMVNGFLLEQNIEVVDIKLQSAGAANSSSLEHTALIIYKEKQEPKSDLF